MSSGNIVLPFEVVANFYSGSPHRHILKTVEEAFECMSQKIAEERIRKLFEVADRRISGGDHKKQLADRYVELARAIGMKYNVSIPADLKKRYCQECFSFLKPGINCRVRVNSKSSMLNYHCEECGEVNRYGF